ncbi:hypothetical protein ECC02_012889 [Trypanosoma cruzi]|uniref:Uncharacterized protein n=1 Tax=Trypanosoma cruzi TaxID=5693 RepID=A0A7J6XJ78_TRYCR|nr:hypothetical protein ECC02_012889 [Trypanosoma cruzi]
MFAGEAGHLNEYVLIKWRCFCTILFHPMNFWKAVIEGTREPIATRRIFFYFSFLIFPPPPLFDSHLAAGPCGWRSPGSATWYAIVFPILTRCTVSREWLSEYIYLEQTSREWRTHCLSTTPLFSSFLISFDDFRIRPAAQANIFFFIGLGLFVVGADCVCVCWCPCGVAWLLRRVSVPLPRCLSVSVLLCVCCAPARVSPSHAACSRCACPVPARQESLHREQQAKSTKAQVTMMLRRVLCVLLFALCCACVCATAQEEGQYDAAVFKAAGATRRRIRLTLQLLRLLLPPRRPRTRPQLPPRHRLLKTRAALAALCGCRCRCCCCSVPLWRPPVLRAECGAGRVRRRCGVPLCAATAHTRGSTDWRLRRVYLSTLQRCGCIYSSVFGCAFWPRAACPCILCDGRALMYISYRRPATCGGKRRCA